MSASNGRAPASALRLLEELPGIADVVWATVTRLASASVPTSLLFTAAEKRAGNTVLASATAIGLAQHQRVPVCLVETNVQRPALAGYLGLESAGLSDVLDGRVELDACLQEPRDCPGLLVLPAGSARAPVSGELTTERLTAILSRLEERCHYLVLDAAPVLEHVETRLLLGHADAVVLVLRARSTRQGDAERAHDILVESGIPILGSIFNAHKTDRFFGGNGRENRSFQGAVRAERQRVSVVHPPSRNGPVRVSIDPSSVGREPPGSETNRSPTSTNGNVHGANGDLHGALGHPTVDVRALPEGDVDVAHQRQVDILERRIAKLTHLLEQNEADLRRIAASKHVDLGIASIYRSVQGLSSEEEALAVKRSLMQDIFQANLDLKAAMTRPS